MDTDWQARLDQAAEEWRDALIYAEEMRDALAAEIVAAYEDGISQRAIAETTLVHRATVKKMLSENGY